MGVLRTSPAVAATGSGTASGGSAIAAFVVGFTPICVNVRSLAFKETGTGTYRATGRGRTATYRGPVTLTMALSKTPAYTGPFGSYGYVDTCTDKPGAPFDVTGTTSGANASGSVSCSYTGTFERTNPSGGNGTDKGSATLTGACTVKHGGVTVKSSPTTELRNFAYVLNSCTGRPPTSCKDKDSFTVVSAQGNPVATTTVAARSLSTATSTAGTAANSPMAAAPTEPSGFTTLDLALAVLAAFLAAMAGGLAVVAARQRGGRPAPGGGPPQ